MGIKIFKKTIPAKPEKVVNYNSRYCDVCMKLVHKFKCCTICKRDVCAHCLIYDEDGGDYPDIYCIKCYNLRYKKYGKSFDKIEQKRDEEINNLWEKIKRDTLK